MGYKFVGEQAGDRAGWSVSAVGDLDGDGASEVLIGAPFFDFGSQNSDMDRGAAYLIASSDFATLDAADGAVDGSITLKLTGGLTLGTSSFRLVGEAGGDQTGFSVSSAGDVDGDGKGDFLIGANKADAPNADSGAAYLVLAADLVALDAADGFLARGSVALENIVNNTGGSYKFIGSSGNDAVGFSVSSAGDVDGDGRDDVLVSAPGASSTNGEGYLVLSKDLAAADQADGSADKTINFTNQFIMNFVGESAGDQAGYQVSSLDADGDGRGDLLISAPFHDVGPEVGAVYLIDSQDLAAVDAQDGVTGSVAQLRNVAAVGTTSGKSYKFVGEALRDQAGWSVSSAGDVDGDGKDDLLIGATQSDDGGTLSGSTYLIAAADLGTLDAADGTTDGIIQLERVAGSGPNSYEFTGEAAGDRSGYSVRAAGDVDGDSRGDFLISAIDAAPNGNINAGKTYLISGAELNRLDTFLQPPARFDGIIELGLVASRTYPLSYTFEGAAAGDQSGWSVGAAINASGANEFMIISSVLADDNGTDSGTVYLLEPDKLGAYDALESSLLDTVVELDLVLPDLAPTQIALNIPAVQENADAGTVIGALTATDPNTGDTHTFTLQDDVGGRFAIDGSNLVVGSGALFDFEAAPTHNVSVRATDPAGLFFDRSIFISVRDVTSSSFTGTPNPDKIEGDGVGNMIEGLESGDLLNGNAGDDTIVGEVGNDSIDGGADNDRVHAGNDNDSVMGGAGNDTLHGDNEEDSLDGGAGNDTVTGGRGDDTVNGGDDNDELWGWLGLDSMNGGEGDDLLIGEEDSDTLDGWSGNDSLFGGQGWDSLIGGDGDDLLSGDTENDTLLGGDGNDTLWGGHGDDLLLGEVGDDQLWGWLGNDILEGGVGNDSLFGEEGDDVLSGGEDNDLLVGFDGNDTLWGFTGNDTLDGGAGDDELRGEAGSDTFLFFDGFGSDTIFGFDATDDAEDIDLSSVSTIASFADLTPARMFQDGPDVVIDTGVGTIRLDGVMLGDLDANDFTF